MTQNIKYNTKGYKVSTPNGYMDFAGVAYMGDKKTLKVIFDNDRWVQCSEGHKFINNNKEEILAIDLRLGDIIFSATSNHATVIEIIEKEIEPVYDLVDVDGGHVYYTNDILSHNCQFISFEETLIDSIHLKDMRGEEPYHTTGRIRWYSPLLPNRMYLISLDPSMGTGGDNAAITVWMMPEFRQVAEWYHNKTDTKGQVRLLMDIVNTVSRDVKTIPGQEGQPEIYWTVENNSLGEAVLTTIADTGEDRFAGDFVSEPGKKRKGFNTTHKVKISACARMKNLIESGKMEIKSKNLVNELKSYVRHNRSFAAQGTNTDDLVSSTLLTIRMIDVVKFWDDNVYDRLADIIEAGEEDDLGPMPLIVA